MYWREKNCSFKAEHATKVQIVDSLTKFIVKTFEYFYNENSIYMLIIYLRTWLFN